MLHTNKVKITLGYKNINKHFDICILEMKGVGDIRNDILENTAYTIKAKSVSKGNRGRVYVLLNKGDYITYEREIINTHMDVKITQIEMDNIVDLERAIPESKIVIARLLLNQLYQSNIEKRRNNNVMGKLLLPCQQNNKIIGDVEYKRFYEVILTRDSILKISMKSYKSSDKGNYVWDMNTGTLKLHNGTDSNDKFYKEGSIRTEKSVVDLINFTDPVENEKTKLGQLNIVLNDIEKKLADYMSIQLRDLEEESVVVQESMHKKNNLRKNIINLITLGGINIIDLIGDENSKEAVDLIKKSLEIEYGILTTEKEHKYTINLIHEREYYLVMGEVDPYVKWSNDNIAQHITKENVKDKNLKNILYKCLQELCIKSDIASDKLTLVEWKDFKCSKEFTFITREPVTSNIDKQIKEYIYKQVKVHVDGRLEFIKHDTRKDERDKKGYWVKIKSVYTLYEEEIQGLEMHVDGLVYSDEQNIQGIIRTNEMIIPEIQNIQKTLKMVNPKGTFEKEDLLKYLLEFKWKYPEYMNDITEMENLIKNMDPQISMEEVKKLINIKGKKGKLFNEFLMVRCEQILYSPVRRKKFKEELGGIYFKDIRYYKDEVSGKVSYYVGSNQALNTSIAKGVLIREIRSLIKEVDCLEILNLTTVEFVRSGQYTVLPFIFKYLREC